LSYAVRFECPQAQPLVDEQATLGSIVARLLRR
jgi:hypothetical protein